MPMSAKKKRRKKIKTYLEWEHADGNALRADGLACGWSCMWMVLRVDDLACGWSCMWMVLCADGLACRWSCVQMGCMGTWIAADTGRG